MILSNRNNRSSSKPALIAPLAALCAALCCLCRLSPQSAAAFSFHRSHSRPAVATALSAQETLVESKPLRRRLQFWRRDTERFPDFEDDGTAKARANNVPATKGGSVFEETKVMLTLSDKIYAYTKLRAHARTSNDKALLKKLEVPQISSKLIPVLIENIHLLKMDDKDQVGFLERASQTVNRAEYMTGSKLNSELIYVGDSSEDIQGSCVYGIGVNRSEKRITVWFRGTASDKGEGGTMKHWNKNFDTTLRLEENPFDDMLETGTPTYQLHRGFMRAMLGRRRKIIMKVLEYMKENPETQEYSLYVSGHSLGAALATLFGFYAAQVPELTRNGPVRLYTFAAPPVGDKSFGKIFKRLEKEGKIRMARIHNADDPVPDTFVLTKYTHVGLGIELDFPGYDVTPQDTSKFSSIKNILKAPNAHKLSRSYEFLNRHASGFTLTLDEMYKKKLGI